jgi:hypothetical protein
VSRGRSVASAPRIGATARQSALDLYYNFASLIPANVIFGIGLILVIGAMAVAPFGWIAVIGLVPLAAGCMRLATSLVRDGHTDLGTYAAQILRPWPAWALGGAQLGAVLVLVVDLVVGSALDNPMGGVLVVSALYGMAILWIYAVVAWPIVLDPVRADQSVATRLRLAGMLLVAQPARMAALAVLLGVFLVVATVAVAAIVTFALALACLVAARYVLPAADRLEGRAVADVES